MYHLAKLTTMRRIHEVQTRLTDFESPSEKKVIDGSVSSSVLPKREPAHLWRKVIDDGEVWGVFEVDDTVLFVRIIDGRIHAHGREVLCKYCRGALEIRGNQVFCRGACGVFQGNFSYDLNDYLRWDGAKSITLRKVIAEEEGLSLEKRDLEAIQYAPEWSPLYEFEEFESDPK